MACHVGQRLAVLAGRAVVDMPELMSCPAAAHVPSGGAFRLAEPEGDTRPLAQLQAGEGRGWQMSPPAGKHGPCGGTPHVVPLPSAPWSLAHISLSMVSILFGTYGVV